MADRPFPIDFSTLDPDPRPRRHLVLPEGYSARAEPDATSPEFETDPQTLLETFIEVALSEPRTEELRREDGQVELVQRSPVLKFRDFITAEAVARNSGSALAIYSRAVVGYWDLGVNRKRVERWLEKTRERLS